MAGARSFWLKLLGKDNSRFGSVGPGLGIEGAKYLASLEVHQILLALNGIHILENMDTAELAEDQAWEFLLTLAPASITGAVQAIVNPIAIK